MKFDDVLKEIGEFGRYQKGLYLLCVCLPFLLIGTFEVINVFLLGVPDHRCAIPELENDTYEIQNENHQELINRYIPDTDPDDDSLPYDRCQYFSYTNETAGINSSRTLVSCSKWVYSTDIFKATFAAKMNLVCDDSYKVSLGTSLPFGGVLFGAIFFGILSDKIGRKKTLYLSFVMLFGATIATPWSNNFAVYSVLQTLTGAADIGVYMTAYVIGMELVGPNKRTFAGNVNTLFFAFGLVVLAGIAYLLRDWFWIQLACAIPSGVFLFYWPILPESPRWLLSKGRVKEAEEIIKKAARINKTNLPENLNIEDDEEKDSAQLWHLFKSRKLCIRTLIIFFNWMVVSMTYYGLSLNTGNLGGNFYVNFLISGLVEFPAYSLVIIFLDRLGRKKMHCGSMLLGGIGCLCTIFTVGFGGDELEPLTITLAMIGKLGSAMAYAIIYVFSAELYPTVVRNAAMGASSFCANTGGFISPYVVQSGTMIGGPFEQALPLSIFGGASVIAGLLSLKLPETLGRDLPETIKDGELFGSSRKGTVGVHETTHVVEAESENLRQARNSDKDSKKKDSYGGIE